MRCIHHYVSCIDAIIVGASCIDHLKANMDACKEGPLDERESSA